MEASASASAAARQHGLRRVPMAGLDNKHQESGSDRKDDTIAARRLDSRESARPAVAKSPSHPAATSDRARMVTSFGVNKGSSGQHSGSCGDEGSRVAPETDSKEKLYEAYNDLHALAQAFSKDFDAPAILVAGHQTDGKSGASAAIPNDGL